MMNYRTVVKILWFHSVFVNLHCIFCKQISKEFSSYTLIEPKLIHTKHKREIHSTKTNPYELKHINDITLNFHENGKEYILDLRLNKDLIPAQYFEKHQKNGSQVINKPHSNEIELCHYNGIVRGMPDSWAAISTCDGVRGMFSDGETFHYIENLIHDSGYKYHVLYKHSDYKNDLNCGFPTGLHGLNQSITKRSKRDTQYVKGPYNENENSRYIELVIVIDQDEYKSLNSDLPNVYKHAKDIANIINSLYMPLNLFIALVGVIVWSDFNEIVVSSNGDTTLTNFLYYRRENLIKSHPNDNAQLLTKVQFENGIVGKGLKGPICTYEFSGGVNSDHSFVVGLVATTIAHEMGHNLGMEHDTVECECPNDRCIMAPSSGSSSPTHWSSCSMEYLALAFEHGMDYCLRNKPEKLFESPVCGNNFVEPGEQCDCGLKDKCDNHCCNPETCMFYPNATCATGKCCDLTTCRPKAIGFECREATHECDLPEYCSGDSEYCPENVFKIDGTDCDNNNAFCYQGSCRTHTNQCRLLWGPTGESSPVQCYKMNTKGTRQGNCGYNRLYKNYTKCDNDDVNCGMLHCKHKNERLEFGMETVSIVSNSFINTGGNLIPCRTAIVDLGLNEIDPGLTPNGAKCGENMMCVNQKCMAVTDLKAQNKVCPFNCNGNGMCNNKGNCHCNLGYAPPYCDQPGPGGSNDSGPASSPNTSKGFLTGLCVLTLGAIPLLLAVLLFSYCSKHQRPVIDWNKSSRKKLPTDPEIGKKPNRTLSPSSKPLVNNPNSLLRSDFLGTHKNFTIKPLAPPPPQPIASSSLTPIRPAPTAPQLELSVEKTEKLQIGHPILDDTTSTTVRELVSMPLKPAPPIPMIVNKQPIVSTMAPDTKIIDTDKSNNNYPTLRRITSFMKNQKTDEKKQTIVKANTKFNKENLKNIEISQPILQNEINVPSNSLPLEEDQHKAVVLRAHSLRYNNSVKQRPSIPNFGSMRSSKRPTSIVATTRPTVPPPPRPPPCTNNGYQVPPNRNGFNENVTENIYSVIDETTSPLKTEENVYKVPRTLESSLLGEIVSAIQERNQESIYTNKSDDNDSSKNCQQTYENIRPAAPSKNTSYNLSINQSSSDAQSAAIHNRPDLVKNCDDIRLMNNSPDVLDAKPVEKHVIIKPKVAMKPSSGTATIGLKKKLNNNPSKVANIQKKFDNSNTTKSMLNRSNITTKISQPNNR
ncbi:disintegrin and metalloproteinase domain-containing protein 28 [Daktulosphaira vitifoliae]|uniref:disintegrin and metalloproteinase domain-containing protein 28 n=1 Tax=Daktulosphaira vitifoliae TaxID=58002 RepID=UPI0021AA5BD0|nr:disintegrin and metalloproteinase domain-containing protein 28 [Daktulosphaira vitifoliae]